MAASSRAASPPRSAPIRAWSPPISATRWGEVDRDRPDDRPLASPRPLLCAPLPDGVRLFEPANGALGVEGPLQQCLRIPFAPAWRIEKIAAIHVNGAGQTRNRVGHRMDDVASEGLGALLAERLGAGSFELAAV